MVEKWQYYSNFSNFFPVPYPNFRVWYPKIRVWYGYVIHSLRCSWPPNPRCNKNCMSDLLGLTIPKRQWQGTIPILRPFGYINPSRDLPTVQKVFKTTIFLALNRFLCLIFVGNNPSCPSLAKSDIDATSDTDTPTKLIWS